ncbi:MAG TPA: hypothetical protein VKB08_18730, partial [Bradyrhizobium sp.]|nr:hypothetical protein [Bradyrhizobium sp.]
IGRRHLAALKDPNLSHCKSLSGSGMPRDFLGTLVPKRVVLSAPVPNQKSAPGFAPERIPEQIS